MPKQSSDFPSYYLLHTLQPKLYTFLSCLTHYIHIYHCILTFIFFNCRSLVMSKQTFLQGTLILIFAGMITRFLGFTNRLVVARFLGEEGVGLYMMALPTLFLVMTLTQIGLPVAISKRVAEADARND